MVYLTLKILMSKYLVYESSIICQTIDNITPSHILTWSSNIVFTNKFYIVHVNFRLDTIGLTVRLWVLMYRYVGLLPTLFRELN